MRRVFSGWTTLVRCSTAATTVTIRAMTKHVPVIHSSEPTRPLTPRKPVDPVRRCCSQLRQPNPTTLKTAKSASAKSAAVVVRISGSPSVRSSGHEPLWRLARRAASIAAAAGAQSPAPDTKVASAPAAQARRNARSRSAGEPGLRGQFAARTPANTSRAGGIHWRYRWGGYLEHPVRADVPGTAHTQGDHEMCWWRRPVVCLMLVGDHHVGDSGQVLQGASILAGWGGVDHDNRIGRLGCPRGCQRGCNRNLQLGQQYIAVATAEGTGVRCALAPGATSTVFSALASTTIIAVPLGPGTVTVLSSPTALRAGGPAAGRRLDRRRMHRRTVPARLRALRPPPGWRPSRLAFGSTTPQAPSRRGAEARPPRTSGPCSRCLPRTPGAPWGRR